MLPIRSIVWLVPIHCMEHKNRSLRRFSMVTSNTNPSSGITYPLTDEYVTSENDCIIDVLLPFLLTSNGNRVLLPVFYNSMLVNVLRRIKPAHIHGSERKFTDQTNSHTHKQRLWLLKLTKKKTSMPIKSSCTLTIVFLFVAPYSCIPYSYI